MLENWTFFKLEIIITTESDSKISKSFAKFLPIKHDPVAQGIAKLQVSECPKKFCI